MKSIQDWLSEAVNDRPMTIENLYRTGETYAKRLKADKDFTKDELVWARKQRQKFLDIIWHACIKEIKPQGFNPDVAASECSSSLKGFYSAESNIDRYSPPAWRNAVIDWLIQAIFKNKEKWIRSRYEFQMDNTGRERIKKLW